MEVRPEVMPETHPYFETEVQSMSIGQINMDYDTMKITVAGVDGGKFILAMLPPEAS